MFGTKKKVEAQVNKSQKIVVIAISALNDNIVETLEQAASYLDHIFIYQAATDQSQLGYIQVLNSNQVIKEKLTHLSQTKEIDLEFLKNLDQSKGNNAPVTVCLFEVDCNSLIALMDESKNEKTFQIRPLYIDPVRNSNGYLQLIKKEENQKKAEDLSPEAVNAQSNLMQVLEIKNYLFTNLINCLAEDFYETSSRKKPDFKNHEVEAHKKTFNSYFSGLNEPIEACPSWTISFATAIEGRKCSEFTPLFKKLLKFERKIQNDIALLARCRGFILNETLISKLITPFLLFLNQFKSELENKEDESSDKKYQSEIALIEKATQQLELVKLCLQCESNLPVADLEDKRTMDYAGNLLKFPELCVKDPQEIVKLGYKRLLSVLDHNIEKMDSAYREEHKKSVTCPIWAHVCYRLDEKKDAYPLEKHFYIKGGALIQECVQFEKENPGKKHPYDSIIGAYYKLNPTIIDKFIEAYEEFQQNERTYFIDTVKKLFLATETENLKSDEKEKDLQSAKDGERETENQRQPLVVEDLPPTLIKLILALQPKQIEKENKKEKRKEESETIVVDEAGLEKMFYDCAFDFLAYPELYDACTPELIKLFYEYLYVLTRDRIIAIHDYLKLVNNSDIMKAGKDKDAKTPEIDAIFKDIRENEYSYQERFNKLITAVKEECKNKQKRHEGQAIQKAAQMVTTKALTKSNQVQAYEIFLETFTDSKSIERKIKRPIYFRNALEELITSSEEVLPVELTELTKDKQLSTMKCITFLDNYSRKLGKDNPINYKTYKQVGELAYEYRFNEMVKGLFAIVDSFPQQISQLNDLIERCQDLSKSEKSYKEKYEIFGGALLKLPKALDSGWKTSMFGAGYSEIAKVKIAVENLIQKEIMEGTRANCKDSYTRSLDDKPSPKKLASFWSK